MQYGTVPRTLLLDFKSWQRAIAKDTIMLTAKKNQVTEEI